MNAHDSSEAELAQKSEMNAVDGEMARVCPLITKASVRVMRSHDYSHFEVTLSSDRSISLTVAEVDDLRKAAARLVDKAISQFQMAKRAAQIRIHKDGERARLYREAETIEAKPESERSPEEQAVLKVVGDDAYWANRGNFDYEDDYNQEEGIYP